MAEVSERVDLPCVLDALRHLSMQAEQFAATADLPAQTSFALQLCLEEAVSNVIRYAGLADGATVIVSLRCDDEFLVVEVIDRGTAFDPLQVPEPAPTTLETAREGGRGIMLMRRFCPDIGYARTAGMNHLRLTFPLHRGPV